MNKKNILLGVILTLVAYLFIASSGSCVRGFPSSFPVFQIVFFQNFISLLCIIPYCLKDKVFHFRPQYIGTHLIRDLAGTFTFLCYFFAIKMLGLVNATILLSVAPFFVPFLWKIWKGGPIEKDVWWSIVLGFFGVLVILRSESNNFLQLGALIGILAALLSATALVSLKVLTQDKEPLSRTLFFFFLVGSIVCLAFSIFQWVPPSTKEWWLLVSIGVLSAFAQIFLTMAYRYGTASFLSPLSYSSIFFTALISWFIFNLGPSWRTWVGAGLIIVGGTFSFGLRVKSYKEIFTVQEKKWWQFWK